MDYCFVTVKLIYISLKDLDENYMENPYKLSSETIKHFQTGQQ